jgi:LuxR family transcriptional regulator, maltose regulon positive regulatory protein
MLRDDRRFVFLAHEGLDRAALPPLAELLTRDEPAVLVVDDAQLLGDTALATLSELVRLAGGGSMIVLAGRAEPRLPRISVPALRASGQLLEFGTRDLALSWREARQLVTTLGSPLTDPEITRIVEETEGWPAAVHLAAASLGYGTLQAACLSALTPAQRTFLTRTSILDRFDRSSCDAVLGYAPGERDLQPLDQLASFLVPLDNRRRWFRYHRLLRGRLREELEATEPGLVPTLHRRAADWFERHGDAERAVEHALAAGDDARFMRIFAATALTTHNEGRGALVEEWLTLVDETGDLEHHAEAAVLAARLHAHNGRAADAARCLDAAVRGLEQATPADETEPIRAKITLMRAATAAETPDAMRAAATSALGGIRADDPWRPYGLLLQGVADVLLGNDQSADDLLEQAARVAGRLGTVEVQTLALAERALLAEAGGEHAAADALLEQISAGAMPLEGFASHALTLAATARSMLRHGRAPEARRSLASAQLQLDRVTGALPWLAVQTRLEIASAFVMLRDSAAAAPLLEEVDALLALQPGLGALRGQRDRLAAGIEGMPAAGHGHAVRLTAAELRLLPLLATHLSFREIGAHFYLSRHTVKTQAISAYRKLGASSRGEAVQRAEELGLIESAAGSRALIPSG